MFVRIEAINLNSGLAVFKVNNHNYGWLKVFDINSISIGDILEGDFDVHIIEAFNITKNFKIQIDCDMELEVDADNIILILIMKWQNKFLVQLKEPPLIYYKVLLINILNFLI